MATPLQESNIRQYYGYAATDKAEGSRELNVYVAELLPFVQGEFNATEIDNEIKTKYKDEEYTSNLTATNTIKCIYRDDNSITTFPPEVRRGEEVIVYCYGDNNTYYWKSTGRNENSRRTDTKRIGISADLSNNGELTDDNTYFIELDTRKNHWIKLSTSNADGEKYRYNFVINAGGGWCMLADDQGNQFYLETDTPRVCMKNSSESLIDLNDKNILIAAVENITLCSQTGDINFVSQAQNILMKANQNITCASETADIELIANQNISQAAQNGKFSLSSQQDFTCASLSAKFSAMSQTESEISSVGKITIKAGSSLSASAESTFSNESKGNYSISSQANLDTSSQGNYSITSAGSLSMSFAGGGTCDAQGGSMAMKMSKLEISS